jgi:hypothetical protein
MVEMVYDNFIRVPENWKRSRRAETERRWDSHLFVVCLILSSAEIVNGGITSSYVRDADFSLDMPLDSDVFRVPPGYNAPQQVSIASSDSEGFYIIYHGALFFIFYVMIGGSYNTRRP